MTTEALNMMARETPAKTSPGRPTVAVRELGFRYGETTALDGLSLEVARGETFGLLGPNGSGKSTLLKVLSGLLRPSSGSALVDGVDVATDPAAVRRNLGVAFQAPSLDGKLTVMENLRFQGYLFGMSGRTLSKRVDEQLQVFRLADRRRDAVETLSGGLKRRVELAKTLLHKPLLLLLDEPSSGLDPAARRDFWDALAGLQSTEPLTVMVATHLMDEAERCGRVALLDRGKTVVVERPDTLKAEMGGEVVTVEAADPQGLAKEIEQRFGLSAKENAGTVKMETTQGLKIVTELLAAYPERIRAVRLGKPTLEDVFLARTGRALDGHQEDRA